MLPEKPLGFADAWAVLSRLCSPPGQCDAAWALAVLQTNSIAVAETVGVLTSSVGSALYGRLSWLNHACSPNAYYAPTNADIGLLPLDVRMLQSVHTGDAVRISYVDPLRARADRQRHLQLYYGFACDCSRCCCRCGGSSCANLCLDAALVCPDEDAEAFLTVAAEAALEGVVATGFTPAVAMELDTAADGLARFGPPTHAQALRLYNALGDLHQARMHDLALLQDTGTMTAGEALHEDPVDAAAAAVGYLLLRATMATRCWDYGVPLVGLSCVRDWARLVALTGMLLAGRPDFSLAAHASCTAVTAATADLDLGLLWRTLVALQPPLGRINVRGSPLWSTAPDDPSSAAPSMASTSFAQPVATSGLLCWAHSAATRAHACAVARLDSGETI